METIFQHRLACPWCTKGEVLSNTSEKVIISVQCSRCRRVFWADNRSVGPGIILLTDHRDIRHHKGRSKTEYLPYSAAPALSFFQKIF